MSERLKDIIIDHIYHYCYNEIVKKIKGDSASITLDSSSRLDDDPVLKSIYENMIKTSKSFSFSYATRDVTYCKVIEGEVVLKSFMDKLRSSGFKKGPRLHIHIKKALDFLLHRSYILQNQPIDTEYALTQKGLNHYDEGKSFEESYLQGRNARTALIISIISITLAIIVFALSFVK